MTRLSPRTFRMSGKRRTALAVAVALACVASGCSSGNKAPQAHRTVATPPKPKPKPKPKPTPSGPCQISATVTCAAGVLPIWTADEVRARLLGAKDVPSSMTHPYDPAWWGVTVHNQYFRQWVNGNYVPGCHYDWIALSGANRVVSGHNHLWSDYGPQYPRWPLESITQYAYVYADSTVQAHDINAVWNRQCVTKHVPYKQLLGGYYAPPEKNVDQTTRDVLSGWAHLRIVEKRYPDYAATPEEDIFDILQNGNVLIVDWTFEQYETDPKLQYWARTLSDADQMLDRQVAKLSAAQ